jgi:hypothetical protein
VCFIVHKTTSEQERAVLTTLYLADAKNTEDQKGKVDGSAMRAMGAG